jgi:hypothetical protein
LQNAKLKIPLTFLPKADPPLAEILSPEGRGKIPSPRGEEGYRVRGNPKE